MDLMFSEGVLGGLVVHIYGVIDQDFSNKLPDLANNIGTHKMLQLDFGGVEEVSSLGVLYWVRFLDSCSNDLAIEYKNCSPPIVAAMRTVPELLKKAKIKSVVFKYQCMKCECDSQVVVDEQRFATYSVILREEVCPKCLGSDLDFCEEPDIFFSFVNR